MDAPVLLAVLVARVIRSDAVPLVEAVEQTRLLVELKQRMLILWVEPDVLMKEPVWLAELLVQQEPKPLPKTKELPPSPHSSETVLLAGPDAYVGRKRWWQGPRHHARD